MPVPNVDTFEHDIAEEIKQKEASLTDIASAGGDIGNLQPPHETSSKLFILLGILFVVVVLGLVMWYAISLSRERAASPSLGTVSSLPDTSGRLLALSPTLNDAVGGNIGRIVKSDFGYTIDIVDYSPVYAYMIRNETAYVEELAIAFGEAAATTDAIPFSFTDTTINNQNMRVGVSGDRSIVYAFVNAKTLLIATSTEGIAALASGILSK